MTKSDKDSGFFSDQQSEELNVSESGGPYGTKGGVFQTQPAPEDNVEPNPDVSPISAISEGDTREGRAWNEEGKSLGYKTLMERERIMDEARLQELKTNIGIMENGIRDSFIKSGQEMNQMDNGELRNLSVLLETELGDRLESLELELLHFDTAASLLGRDCAVTRQIVKECKIECQAMIRHLEDLMEKREVSKTKPTFHRRNLPTFAGTWHGRNVFNFEKKITFNLTKMEVPKSDWAFWILDRLSGPAIVTVKQAHRDLCMVEWEGIMETLVDSFGHEFHLRDSLIDQHQAVGRLAEIFPNTNWAKRSLRLRRHLSLIGEALELHCDHKREVIDHAYSSAIVSILTPRDRMSLRGSILHWATTKPLERAQAVQREMEQLLECCMAEASFQKVSYSADENPATGFDPPSDDPSETDTNPSPY